MSAVLGLDVHSELRPTSHIFNRIRFTLFPYNGNTRDVVTYYTNKEISWIIELPNYNTPIVEKTIIPQLIKLRDEAPTQNIRVEILNEPDGEFKYRNVLSPEAYIAILKTAWKFKIDCLQRRGKMINLHIVGGNFSNWRLRDGMAYFTNLIKNGLLNYCDEVGSHPYGMENPGELWDIIQYQKNVLINKPFSFTEYSDIYTGRAIEIARQSLFENIPITLYDANIINNDLFNYESVLGPLVQNLKNNV
jgi:hypothetical protein